MSKELVYIDHDTGSIEPFFGVVYTKDQLDAYHKLKEQQKCRAKGEEFIWILFRYGEQLFPTVDKASLIRLIFLATFIDKNKDAEENRLTDNRGKTFFTKKDVKQVLKLSPTCFDGFWHEMVSAKIITLNNSGEVILNDELFQYGRIKELNENRMRLFCGAVRRLYVRCQPRQHKLLGYIFKMIPFVSKEYNIVCLNPEESDVNMVRPMTLECFCKYMEYDTSHAKRLLQDILSVKIDGQQLVKYVSDGKLNTSYLVVNPRAYYAGYHTAELAALFN